MSAEIGPIVGQPESSASTNDTAMVPESFTSQESAKIGGQWETLKESEGWAEKVKNVITHPVAALSIFYNERQIAKADAQYSYWMEEAKVIKAARGETNASLSNSVQVRDALKAVQEQTGIQLDVRRYGEEKQSAANVEAEIMQKKRGENMEFVLGKLRSIKEKKTIFEQERTIARSTFIETYAKKAEGEKTLVAKFDENIRDVGNSKSAADAKMKELGAHREKLQEYLATQKLLPIDKGAIQEMVNNLSKQEFQSATLVEQYTEQLKGLNIERTARQEKQAFWEAKITPRKPKEMPVTPLKKNSEPVLPVTNSETPKRDEGNTSTTTETEDSAQATKTDLENTPTAEEKDRPKTLKEASTGLIKEIEGAGEDEFAYARESLSAAQQVFEERYGNSRIFTWIMWFFDIFAERANERKNTPKT